MRSGACRQSGAMAVIIREPATLAGRPERSARARATPSWDGSDFAGGGHILAGIGHVEGHEPATAELAVRLECRILQPGVGPPLTALLADSNR